MSDRLTYTGTAEDAAREWELIHARDVPFSGWTPTQRGAVNCSTTTCGACGQQTAVAVRCHECGDWLNECASPDIEHAKRYILAADAQVAATVAPIQPARTCATVASPSGVRPAGYVLGFDSDGFCGSAALDTAAEVRELTEAIPVEGALYARAADYAVEPGTVLCVALYNAEGDLVLGGETVTEPGPRVPPYRVDLRYRVRTLDATTTTTTATPEV